MYNIIRICVFCSVNLTWIVQYNIIIFQKVKIAYKLLFMEGRIERPQLYWELEIKVFMSSQVIR